MPPDTDLSPGEDARYFHDYAALVDGLRLFGIGFSWGGYESLALPVAALIAWFGMAQVESRLSTLTKLETFQDDRFSLWNPLIAVFQRNPLLGTGEIGRAHV